jgi:hypothetical protein
MGTDLRWAADVVGGARVPRAVHRGPSRAQRFSVWSVTLGRVGVLVVLATGCIFTPRPMIPVTDDDAGGGFVAALSDAGRASSDAATGVPAADAGSVARDASAGVDAPPSPNDSNCRRAGDAGFVDDAGNPCDPRTTDDDGGAPATPDAACDRDAATDGAATDGAATDGAASCDGGVGAAVVRGPR